MMSKGHCVEPPLVLIQVFVLGDLNAGGQYVPSSSWPSLRSRLTTTTTKRGRPDFAFRWLIPDHADTTASDSTNAAYDRILACSSQAEVAVERGSPGVFRCTL